MVSKKKRELNIGNFKKNILYIEKNKSSNLFNSWSIIHNDYNIVKISENEFESFIKLNFEEYYDKFIMISNNLQKKSDIIKFCLVYHYGGIFVDSKNVCLRKFDELFDLYKEKELIVGLEKNQFIFDLKDDYVFNKKNIISNEFIVSIENCNIIKNIVEYLLTCDYDKFIEEKDYDEILIQKLIFNKVINIYFDTNKIKILDFNYFSTGLFNSNISLRNNDKAFMLEDNSNNNLSNNIDVYLLVKDNSKYLKKYFPAIRKCLEDNLRLKWIIYENGSNDDTKELIKYYFGNYENEDLKYLDEYHNFGCQNYDKNLISLNEGEVDDSTFNKNNTDYIKSLK